MAKIGRELRHLGLVGVADAQRSGAGEHRHRGDHSVLRNLANGVHDVTEATHGTLRHDRAHSAEFRPIGRARKPDDERSEEHTSELQSLMRISYAVFCLKKKITHTYS